MLSAKLLCRRQKLLTNHANPGSVGARGEPQMRPIIKLEAVQATEKSQGIIREWLVAYGCRDFAIGLEGGNGYVLFKLPLKDGTILPVKLVVRTQEYARTMMERDPYEKRGARGQTVTKKRPRGEWEERHRADAERAAWSLACDWLRTELSMVELGVATVEEVFLSRIASANGQTVAQLFDIRRLLAGKNFTAIPVDRQCRPAPGAMDTILQITE